MTSFISDASCAHSLGQVTEREKDPERPDATLKVTQCVRGRGRTVSLSLSVGIGTVICDAVLREGILKSWISDFRRPEITEEAASKIFITG